MRSLGFITIPLLTYYIQPADMGAYNLLWSYYGVMTEVCALGLRQLYVVDYFKSAHKGHRAALILQVLSIYFFLTTPLFFLSYLGVIALLGWKYAVLGGILALSGYLRFFTEFYLNTLRLQMRFFCYNLFCLSFALLQLGFVITCVVGLQKGILGLACSVFIAEVLALLVAGCITRKSLLRALAVRSIKRKIKFPNLLFLLKNSYPFIPSVLSFWVLTNVDQWMLEAFKGLSAAGLYSFALKMPQLLDYLVSSTFILVYTPIHYEGLKKDFTRQVKRSVLISLFCLLAGSASIYLFQSQIYLLKFWINIQYQEALGYIAPLLLAATIRLSMNVMHLTLHYQKKVSSIFFIHTLGALLNAGLNAWWIPTHGTWGCIAATLLSFCAMYLLTLALHLRLQESKAYLQAA